MNILEVRRIVGRIKAQLFKKSNNYSIGMLKSHFRGSGLQFKEHRQYTHGDDVRFIDWKILAKTGDPFIKTFEEERNVHIAVIVDAGPSMRYGWKNVSKLQASLEITCMLYLLAGETNDFIHTLILADDVIDVPTGSGEKGIAQFISTLTRINLIDGSGKLNLNWEGGTTDLAQREKAIKKHLARNREVVILSDWLNLLEPGIFDRVVFNRRTHCFRVLAPLDQAETENITMLVSGGEDKKGRVRNLKKERKDNVHAMNPRIKDLDIKGRYLDEFIRELI